MSGIANIGIQTGIGLFASSGSSWTPQKIADTFLFYGEVSKITGGQLYNQVLGSSDWLTVGGSAGSYTFQAPNDNTYKTADEDYAFYKTDGTVRTVTEAELIDVDFARVIIKYDDISPYAIRRIGILKSGVVLSTEEENELIKYFFLNIWWNGTLNTYGHVKQNRGGNGSPFDISLLLTSTGNGTGVSTLTLRTVENMTLTLGSNAKFYTDAAGTLNESATWAITTGADRTIYLKCTTGTAILTIPKNKISRWVAWTSSTNAASLSGDISRMTALGWLSIQGVNAISGSIQGLRYLTLLLIQSNNILTGNISGLTLLTYVNTGAGLVTISGSLSGLTLLTSIQMAGYNTIGDDISGLTLLTYVNVTGYNRLFGSIEALNVLLYLLCHGYSTLSGDPAGLTSLQYIDDEWAAFSTIAITRVNNITGLCYLGINAYKTFTSANVNQLLADMWANKDAAKAKTERVIRLRGGALTGAPSGQGITDKAALAAYRSPTPPGTAALWTVTTR